MIGFQNAKHRQMVHIKIQKRIVIPGHDELYQDTHTFNSLQKYGLIRYWRRHLNWRSNV